MAISTLRCRPSAQRRIRAVAVEADRPDAYRVNRCVRRVGDDQSPLDALADFQ